MIFHTVPHLSIVFGDIRHAIDPDSIRGVSSTDVMQYLPETIFSGSSVQQVAFGHQVHGDSGIVLRSQEPVPAVCTHEADFIATNRKDIASFVLTADCVPLVLWEPTSKAFAVVHAGWRGTRKGVVKKAVKTLVNEFRIAPRLVQVWVGPSAKKCCYQVSPDFIDEFDDCSYRDELFTTIHGNVYFDVPYANQLQLHECGVPHENIIMTYNTCTMCSPLFCSVRRGCGTQRQITGAFIR